MKVVLQDGIKDCGICCLLSIIRYYKGGVSKEYLRDLTNTSKSGVTAYNLVSCAKKLGFDSYALNGEIEKIDANDLPVIAHVAINKSYMHFVVIYKIDFINKTVLIMDPAKGKVLMSLSEFKLQSTNNYIFLKPIKKIPLFQDKEIIKRSILEFILLNKKYLFFFIFLTLIYFIFNILSAFHFKYIIELSVNYNIDKNLLLISSIVLLTYILKNISSHIKNIILFKYNNMFDEVITTKTYKQIILLPYLYYKNRTTGEVVSRLRDLSEIKSFLISLITTLTTDLLSLIIFIILLFNINVILALLSLLLFTLFILINFIFNSLISTKIKNYHEKEDIVNSYLIESLSCVDAVKGMHIEKRIIDKFTLKYRKYLSSFYSLMLTNESNIFIKNIIHDIFIVFLIYFGAVFVIKKELQLSELIVFQSIFNFFLSSFTNVVNLINEYPKYKVSRDRIEDIFMIKNENFIGGQYFSNYILNKKIIYKNLTYSYGSKKLLNNVTFCINKSDKIFLYGPSGTGKSTFVKLLMRYVDIPFGYISIGGIDINHYHLDVIRRNITYVSQQEFLFNDTIINNITLNRKIDNNKLNRVLKITRINSLGDMNKQVEENGFNFSGGERQRLILARALLKESDIYIFDEATNQIDIKLEREIISGIMNYLKNKMVIVISHRFDNKDLFERIIKIENGKIDEEKL